MMIQSVWKNLTGLQKTSGVTLNPELEPKTHHQTPMTCAYGYKTLQCTRNTIFKYINYVSIFVATVLEVHDSVLSKEEGVPIILCI